MSLKETLAIAYLKGLRPITGSLIYNRMASQFTQEQQKQAKSQYDEFKASCKELPMLDIFDKIDQLSKHGFDWISDPLSGALDFPGSDWLFFARKGGDCDKWASFHYDILSPQYPVTMWAIFNGLDIANSAHIIDTTFDKSTGKYYLLSNNDHIPYSSEQECLNSFKTEDHVCTRYPNLWYIQWKKNCREDR